MTLRLRPFTRHDIAPLKGWFPTERAVLQWAGVGLRYPLRNSDLRTLIKAHKGQEPQHEIWAAETPDSDMVAHLQIWYNQRLKQATLGRIAIAPDRRGQGLAAPLVSLAIARAFSRVWVNRLELRVYDFNSAAIAAYKRAGFIHEGTRRQSTPIGNDYWNTYVMSLLRQDYKIFDKRTERE